MNYTKFSKDSENNVNETIELHVSQDHVFDAMANLTDDVIKNDIIENNEPIVIEKGDAKLMGVVSGCAKLNVRKKPSLDAPILCVIKKGDEVEFNMDEESTNEDFYAIITTTKIKVKGYCMKEYITIK